MRQKHSRLWTALIALTLVFIWGNSLLAPAQSWQISGAVQKLLALLGGADGALGAQSEMGGVIVRKIAHFAEFFVLGVLLRLRFGGGREKRYLAPLAGVLAALADETIQYYTGRTSLVLDVWIDFAGVIVGILLVIWICARKARSKGTRREAP